MARTRSRSPRRRKDTRSGPGLAGKIGLGLLGLLVISAIFGLLGYNAFFAERPDVDVQTGCLKGVPPARYVVLVDQTDTFNAVQKADIRNQLEEAIRSVPRYGEVAVYMISQDLSELPSPLVRACNPGTKEDADALIEAAARVEKKWASLFDRPLEMAFSQAFTSLEADTSPIIETIQAVTVREFGDHALNNSTKRLIVISDLLQHTPALTHYGAELPDVVEFLQSDHFRRLRADLRDVSIELLYLQRTTRMGHQGPDHIKFWLTLFGAQGAEIDRIYSVSG